MPVETARFVVQKHAARRLHYDLRLEIAGVLVSWAIPRGPSLDPGVRRLAVRTEDHPLEYADFEGVIPDGVCGAGTVMVWDRGKYKNIRNDRSMEESLADGKIKIRLTGEKLKGDWALVRMGGGNSDQWLLIKMGDEYADRSADILKARPESVLTGRGMDEITDERITPVRGWRPGPS
ncbi:MAG: DNA polymerase ligase N-terminal domain-containing protein [Methanoculleaceae archaeon]